MTEMLKQISKCLFAAVLAVLCLSCEKMVVDEDDDAKKEDNTTTTDTTQDANVVLRLTSATVVSVEDLTRAVVPVTDCCTCFNFVLYRDGDKVKSVTQHSGDEGYGVVAMTLERGTYKLLVLAHSSQGNPSLADPAKLQFTNADRFTDTFYYYGDLTVTSEPQTYDIRLQRASTVVRMYFDEAYPEGLARMKVYYTGGSGVLNAVTGYGGEVNSQQEKTVDVSERVSQAAPFTIPVYTFLQADTGSLTIRVTALKANGDVIVERTYTGVPVERNKQTSFRGYFFDPEVGFSFTAETDWEELTTVSY